MPYIQVAVTGMHVITKALTNGMVQSFIKAKWIPLNYLIIYCDFGWDSSGMDVEI